MKRKGQREDLTGKRFGRLVVIAEDHWENRQYYWLCKCGAAPNGAAISQVKGKEEKGLNK